MVGFLGVHAEKVILGIFLESISNRYVLIRGVLKSIEMSVDLILLLYNDYSIKIIVSSIYITRIKLRNYGCGTTPTIRRQ